MVAPRMIHPTSLAVISSFSRHPSSSAPSSSGARRTPPPGRDGLRRRSLARLLGVLRVRPLPPPPARALGRPQTRRDPNVLLTSVTPPPPPSIDLPVAPRPTLPQRVDDAPRRGHGRVPLARRPVPARLARARDPRDPPGARPPVRPRRRSRGALRLQRLARRRPHRRAAAGSTGCRRRRVGRLETPEERAPGVRGRGPSPARAPPPSSSSAGRSISPAVPPSRFRLRTSRVARGRRPAGGGEIDESAHASRAVVVLDRLRRGGVRPARVQHILRALHGGAGRAAVVSWWDEGLAESEPGAPGRRVTATFGRAVEHRADDADGALRSSNTRSSRRPGSAQNLGRRSALAASISVRWRTARLGSSRDRSRRGRPPRAARPARCGDLGRE